MDQSTLQMGEGNLIITIKTLYDHGIMHSFSFLCVEGICLVSCSQADAATKTNDILYGVLFFG